MAKVNRELMALAQEALDLGFDSICEGDHSPFVILQELGGKQHLVNLESASGVIDAELVNAGREVIDGFSPGQFYALVFDGYVTHDNGKQDAVLVEAGRRGETEALIFAQKYKPDKRSQSLVRDGKPFVVRKAKHLWPIAGNDGGHTEQSVYTILHSKELAAIYRGGRCGVFREGKKWVSAMKLVDRARKSGERVPIVFAPGENIWELTYWGIVENIELHQENGKWFSDVTVTDLKRIPQPRPNKTQLVVKSTGKRLPKDHIRTYVLVQTPAFLTKARKGRKK